MIITFSKRYFQKYINDSINLFYKISDDKKPYEFKYQSKNILEDLLKNEFYNLNIEDIDDYDKSLDYYHGMKGIIFCLLGRIDFETEENSNSEINYKKSLKEFSKINIKNIDNYLLYLLEIYNTLGYIYANYNQFDKGIGFLLKSEKIIDFINKDYIKINFINNFDLFIIKKFDDEMSKNEIKMNYKFKYYSQGYYHNDDFEDISINTYFYLAQLYSSTNKDKSAYYCGLTLQKQFSNYDKIDKKEFFNNCIGLSEYYLNDKNFNMSIYLVLTLLKKLPENKYKKRKANSHYTLGNIFYNFFKFNINFIENHSKLEFEKFNENICDPVFILFNNEVAFPKFKLFDIYEESKKFSRLSITYLNKAKEIFKLDNNASIFMNIMFTVNDNYTLALNKEKNIKRKIIILEKQRKNLNLIYKDLNKKYFEDF